MALPPDTLLTCTKDDCGCRIRIEVPCPHGEEYTCACGHALAPISPDHDPVVTPGA